LWMKPCLSTLPTCQRRRTTKAMVTCCLWRLQPNARARALELYTCSCAENKF
jgi:hypothetical protein